nr:copia protein [Tanacetum cinerariifolium]
MASDTEWKWSCFCHNRYKWNDQSLPPKTAKEVIVRERERKTRTTLLMALSEDHLAKFHKMADAKEMWEAIKSRFGGNDESKKMHKYLFKRQFEEIHGASVLHEDANQKFLRSIPSSWSQVALIIRTNLGLDTLSFDDLYNNLRVFERHVKGTTASSSNTQNATFVFAENTNSTNDVSTAYSVSSHYVLKSQKEGSSSYTNEVIHSFFANQSSAPQLDYDDLEQINDDDMEEMDLKWQGILQETAELKGTKTSEEDMFGNKTRDNGRRPAYQNDSKALITIDGEDIYWSGHVEKDAQNYAMMAYSSSNSGSDNEELRSQYLIEDEDFIKRSRSTHGDEVLLNTQMSANDKFGIGYGDYRYGSILSYGNKVLQSVFMNKASDLEDTPVNDRYANGMHAVPPPMIGNYMPYGPDVEIDYSKFTYGLKQTSADESDSKSSEYASCESDSSVETSTSMPERVKNASKVVCEPKVWTDAPIIEEENTKETGTTNHIPKIEMQDRNGHTRKGLGYAFTRKTCFVCGSFSHLIKDCDFHEKRMVKQAELTKSNNRVIGQIENKPVWNNVQRVNHQNKFIPSVLLTKTGKFPVNAARQNYYSQAASTSTASKVNTARPFVNETRPKRIFYKNHSPNKGPFYNTTAQRTTFSYQKVNNVGNKSLSVVKGNEDTADNLHRALKDKRIVDSGCSKHMTGNKAHLADYQEFKGGSVAFGGSNGRITGKGKIKTGRQHNMYSFNLKNIDPSRDLACLFAKASIDEFKKWHRRLGHVNFKNLNKLVKGNLVRGLPSKICDNDHTCVACQKGKQHKASCKAKTVNSVNQPLQILHMDLFGPTSGISNQAGKSDSRFLVGYSLNSKDFRVYNLETKRVEENLHVNFLENKPNVTGKGHAWMFDLDYLTNSMNYKPVLVKDQANKSEGLKEDNNSAGTQANDDQGVSLEEIDIHKEHFVLPIWSAYSTTIKSSGDKIKQNTDFKTCEKPVSQVEEIFLEELEKLKRQDNINLLDTLSTPLSTVAPSRAFNDGELSYPDDTLMPHLQDIYASLSEGIFTDSSYNNEDLPFGKKAIGTKWVYRNKNDEKDVVVRNKARLVAQGHRQEEGIDYNEVFALVARIEAIRIFLAFASYMGFIFYQMDVKSTFLYGTINEEVYMSQPLGFVDPKFPNKVYKVVKALYGLHQAPRACVKTASTPIVTQKSLVKDKEAGDVDVLAYSKDFTSLSYEENL